MRTSNVVTFKDIMHVRTCASARAPMLIPSVITFPAIVNLHQQLVPRQFKQLRQAVSAASALPKAAETPVLAYCPFVRAYCPQDLGGQKWGKLNRK